MTPTETADGASDGQTTGDLRCVHCGAEKTYADANIADVRGETCPEHTETVTAAGRTSTRELQHEWIESSA